MLKRVSNIRYRNFVIFDIMPIVDEENIEDDRVEVYEGMNNGSEEDFEATYEADDEDEDGDVGRETAVKNVVVPPAVSQPMDVPSFMRNLDLDAMHAPKFSEYVNKGTIGMKYSSRKSVIATIRSYTIFRGVDYSTFYAKCKTYGRGCDWLIRASLIQKKKIVERYADTTVDHSKLDSGTVAEAIRSLVETNPSINVKSIIVKVQSRFNYTISY
ncbi:hypothetical protein Ahy_A08g041026 [Arachis hypogaea]|uniref:Transposase MuDR plant domain-containing protein n=1 Tax=Arachis hypogaea TaxID=3818 RepID=A0A445C1E0_ARAHY|nr:hypothetical protein Ahy_A08g041026 [Arachis hypogaea]